MREALKCAAFRFDASVQTGGGHFVRCLALGQGLRERGWRVSFLTRVLPGVLRDDALAQGIEVLDLPPAGQDSWEADAWQSAAALAGLGAVDWLVVDHYGLDARWEKAVRASASRIAVIDDLADRVHDCAMLLDPVEDRETRYAKLVPAQCRTLLGPRYALLRPQFAAARELCAPRTKGVSSILVSYGGSDPTQETEKALGAIRSLRGSEIRADVVVGGMNPRHREIASLCTGCPGATCHTDVRNMAQLMSRAQLAIGAAGGTAWERCCLYLPSIIVVAAQNQITIANILASYGAGVNLGWHEGAREEHLLAVLRELIQAPERLADMSRRAGSVTDGLGVRRVVHEMEAAACA